MNDETDQNSKITQNDSLILNENERQFLNTPCFKELIPEKL